ncbi:LamG-like jellyroll fold domain-containing protein [Bacteroides sp. K03]|uniref:LamG-like jellyroll fold domain-containing protein n=1 Tax=Bacteroides sp. K03 TaxID=2718928 RepID=UPI0021030331|nr:LamG-like jellyroll fold domain-containing protein [Bacteroides sp. K03]
MVLRKVMLACLIGCSLTSYAQTVNYAISNEGAGYVKTSVIQELNGSSEMTVQMWIKPTSWVKGIQLFNQDNFIIESSDNQSLVIKAGVASVICETGIVLNSWSQLTIVFNNGNVKCYVNNELKEVSGTLPPTLSDAVNPCLIGKNFNGQIDEIRVWKKALEQADLYWNNTLHKFNPNYTDLVSYWKCDQEQCEHLVDYRFAHHGEMNNVQRIAVEDNAVMRYRVVTGYTNLMRFTDRANIDRDMFLMTNDLILLSAKVQKDGSLFPEYPDNSATPTNVSYLAEFQGRNGVMDFHGVGSNMISEDGRVPFDPTTRFYESASPNNATVAGWVYIDSWVEGAGIFSNYVDEDNCMTIKLGKEADKEIIVNLCGTIGTLKNQVEIDKWHYISVTFKPMAGDASSRRFNPFLISVDYKDHDRLSSDGPVELGGKSMTIQKVPAFQKSRIILGENFDGKLDEVMVWGTDRSGSAKNDSENGYQWNVGNWNNIFLNAYWKGDDPENIGKDSQSYTGMIDFIRNYYAGYRGMKIRIGIIYPEGENWKYGVLNNDEYANNLIRDAKVLLEHCDGLDVDLEWMYSASDWTLYNKIVGRLINEVMAGKDKTFTCSLHKVSYNGFSKDLMKDVDYFTFQLYGPNKETYYWDYYPEAYNWFTGYGFPKDKILMSYGILLVNNGEEGYKDLFEKYGMNDSNFDPDLNSWDCGGTMRYYNGVNQTKRKQDFIIEKDCRGTMYFDMGNDQPVSDYKSLIRAQNDVLASNVDTLITKVDLAPVGIENVKNNNNQGEVFSFYLSPSKGQIVLTLSKEEYISNAFYEIYAMDGKTAMQGRLNAVTNVIPTISLEKGTYLIQVRTNNGSYTKKLHIN